MTQPSPDDRIGVTLAKRYVVQSVIGRGGMGVVYAGEDTQTGCEVAVKVLSRLSSQALLDARRFLLEAETLSGVRHRHVVQILDLGVGEDGAPFLVMERLHGSTLDEYLKGRTLDPRACLKLLVPIVGAVARVHDAGFLHRDLKPSNIFIMGGDADGHAKLFDFGIVKRLELDGALTANGMAVGTPGYMAPEQLAAAEVTFATDVYGMGVTLLHCLSGKHPLHPMMLEELIEEASARGTPKALIAALRRAVQPDPASRYPDMRTFAEGLAVSAYLGNIELPEDPDPDGLPEWKTWLREAAMSTQALPAKSPPKTATEPAAARLLARAEPPREQGASTVPFAPHGAPQSAAQNPLVGSRKTSDSAETAEETLQWIVFGLGLTLLLSAAYLLLR